MDKKGVYSSYSPFGVAVIECSACERPVVVSNVGGLPETVQNNVTGIVINSTSNGKIKDLILKAINSPKESTLMGQAGRDYVLKSYDWNQNLSQKEDSLK